MFRFFSQLKKIKKDTSDALIFIHLRNDKYTDTNPSYMGLKFQRLPQSLSEALEALENNNTFTDLIGERLLAAIKEIRKVYIFIQYYLTFISCVEDILNLSQISSILFYSFKFHFN